MTLILCTATKPVAGTYRRQRVSEVKDFKWMDGLREKWMAGFMEGKRRSVEEKERHESWQKKLNQAEHGNLCHVSHYNVLEIVPSVVVSALLPLCETTTQVNIFQWLKYTRIEYKAMFSLM